MTETVVDQRGRVLIPEEIRESAGLKNGAIVAIEKARDLVVNQITRETEWREGKMTMIHKDNVAVIVPARGHGRASETTSTARG